MSFFDPFYEDLHFYFHFFLRKEIVVLHKEHLSTNTDHLSVGPQHEIALVLQ